MRKGLSLVILLVLITASLAAQRPLTDFRGCTASARRSITV
jgi:hypothetical protein